MPDILKMGLKEILALRPEDIFQSLNAVDIVHIAAQLGALWKYDYEAAKRGKLGCHALLKFGIHSNAFFASGILLAPPNIRTIIASHMARKIRHEGIGTPSYTVGVPEGATSLGDEIACYLDSRRTCMEKIDGKIRFMGRVKSNETILLVEDFCTRGTGFTEAVLSVLLTNPEAKIIPYNPVILNRGGLKTIAISEVGDFSILPIVEYRVDDWNEAECPLCKMGSKPIRPKATNANWELLINSQK